MDNGKRSEPFTARCITARQDTTVSVVDAIVFQDLLKILGGMLHSAEDLTRIGAVGRFRLCLSEIGVIVDSRTGKKGLLRDFGWKSNRNSAC